MSRDLCCACNNEATECFGCFCQPCWYKLIQFKAKDLTKVQRDAIGEALMTIEETKHQISSVMGLAKAFNILQIKPWVENEEV